MRSAKLTSLWGAAFMVLVVSTLPAQAPGGPPEPPGFDGLLFPPDLVMRHQRTIGLSEAQSRAILAAAQEAQVAMLEAQWALSPELQAFHDLLSRPRIDEQEVRTRLGRITEMEAGLKQIQLLLMVRVKNQLTPEQQQRLQSLRESDRPPRPRPPGS